jgi:hypothetical protein
VLQKNDSPLKRTILIKEQTSFDDLLDALRLALQAYDFT